MLNFAFLSFVSKLRRLRAKSTLAPLENHSASSSTVARLPACVEALESRICPSVSVAVGHFSGGSGDDLRIRTADSGQHIIITEDSVHDQTLVQVDGNGDGRFDGLNDFSRLYDETFGQIKVSVKKGQDDAVEYLLASDLQNTDRQFVLKLGAGANSFDFDAQQHAITDNAKLTFNVTGADDAGNAVNFAFDEISNSEVDVTVALGSGTHDVRANFYGPIHDDSLVNANVSFGAGNHSATINLLGDVSRSSVHVLIDGGDDARGHDNVTYNVAGALSEDALVDIGMSLHAGDDNGTVIVSQNTFAVHDTSRFYVTMDGGVGNDDLRYSGDGAAGSILIEGLADALILSGSGNDRVTADFSAVDTLDIVGTFRLHAVGESGNDSFAVALSNTAISNGSYDVVLQGKGGDDVFSFFNDDPTDGLLYDTYGYHLVDGGKGFDQATITGSDVTGDFVDVRRVEAYSKFGVEV